MSELLLEIFSEEVPARMQKDACRDLKNASEKLLNENRIIFSEIQTFVTPRRLVLRICGINDEIADQLVEKKGPRVDGKPEAIEGFLRTNNLKKDELKEQNGFYIAYIKNKGGKAIDIIKTIMPKIISSINWPKSMKWGKYDFAWVRPIQNIMCIYNSEIVDFNFHHFKSNNVSYGHRFMDPAPFEVKNFQQYKDQLYKQKVILSSDDRKSLILAGVNKIAHDNNLIVNLDSLDEVVGLVEWPVVMQGEIPKDFIHLPKEVLQISMKTHQRYFTFEKIDGSISNIFAFVANIQPKDNSKIIHGNEKVLKARLFDAKFFYEQDLKHGLDFFLEKLKKVIFHNKIGSMYERCKRLEDLSGFIAHKIGADEKKAKLAGLYAKADLATDMVGEFPELQGIMGGYYAKTLGNDIALAISEHYKPAGNHDEVPTEGLSICVSLADKIDSLAALYTAGERATSSKDPFALRRHALGIIKIIINNNLKLDLDVIFDFALSKVNGANNKDEIIKFILERLKFFLKDEGYRADVTSAIMEKTLDKNLSVIVSKISTLSTVLTKGTGEDLLYIYKRVSSILQNQKDALDKNIKEDLLLTEEERNLYQDIRNAEEKLNRGEFEDKLSILASIKSDIDKFFDNVMVNADDLELKNNRIKLLYNTKKLFDDIANFSLIEV